MKQAVPWWFFFLDVTFHYLMWLVYIAAVTWGWCDFSQLMWLKYGACITSRCLCQGGSLLNLYPSSITTLSCYHISVFMLNLHQGKVCLLPLAYDHCIQMPLREPRNDFLFFFSFVPYVVTESAPACSSHVPFKRTNGPLHWLDCW